MRSFHNLSALIQAGLIVTLLLAGEGRSQDQGPSTAPSLPPGNQPLKADPSKDLFELALQSYREAGETTNLRRRNDTYSAAARQFNRFYLRFRDHPDAIKAVYYRAICYQKLDNREDYLTGLDEVLTLRRTGALVGAAAYQRALEHYKVEQYAEAEPLFEVAASESDEASYRHRALYIRALCFEKLEKKQKTVSALKAILADTGSPYQPNAERVLAHHYLQEGMNEEALAHFLHLSESTDIKTRADAILQCAQLARKLGKRNFARKYFEDILVTPELEQWHGESQLALMSEASLEARHKDVITYYEQGDYPLKKEPRGRRLQIAAKSYAALGEEQKSTALLRKLASISPDDLTALEASYLVLSREYRAKGEGHSQQIQAFLKRFGKKYENDPRIHNARLMLAESYHEGDQFALAVTTYQAIDLTHISAQNHPGLLYRMADAQLRAGNKEAALDSFNLFITEHPGHPQINNAIVNRAEIFLEKADTNSAHKEFDRLIKQTARGAQQEYAWAQKAILYKKTIDTSEDGKARLEALESFAQCHLRLLADFPERANAKQATSHFWLGWSLYRLDRFAECIMPFQQARQVKTDSLHRSSTLHLALAYYHLQEKAELQQELDLLLRDYRDEQIPRPVFAWLGNALHDDRKYDEAWKYLSRAITLDEPSETKLRTWRAAGGSALESGNHEASLRPLNIVLQVEENDYRKAETHFLIGRAHLALENTEQARNATEACLSLKPQGNLNPRARLQLGEIAMALGDPDTATQYFVPVVELYSKDPEIAVIALGHAISALKLKDTPESLKIAQGYRVRLEELRKKTQTDPRD